MKMSLAWLLLCFAILFLYLLDELRRESAKMMIDMMVSSVHIEIFIQQRNTRKQTMANRSQWHPFRKLNVSYFYSTIAGQFSLWKYRRQIGLLSPPKK